ncbi:MAG: glucose-1-phosphate adenylyltransferase [Acidobacteriia bacterium]|nr:glucose-1-phosphate adenylyltransferase [Terriglobia bacterium]
MSGVTGKERDAITVILGGGRGARLDPLTRLRSKPAVPIAGKYRLIDIPISNSIHSGMERIFVLTQYNSISLHRHIVRTYKFDPFSRGFVQILAAQQTPEDDTWFQGTADAVRQNLRIVTELYGELVLVLAGDHVYRMDYGDLVREHVENRADVTLSVSPCSAEEVGGFGAVRVAPDGRVVEFREKPGTPEARAGMEVPGDLLERRGVAADRPYLASMGIYLFDKKVLVEALENRLADFGRDVIPAAVSSRKVYAHLYGGYWRDIGTIRAFYDAHLDLVSPDPPFTFGDPGWPIYTHPRYLPGARVSGTRFNRAILSEGSLVIGSTVEDSVIGVRAVLHGVTVRRSLLMGADPHPPEGPPGAPPVGIGEGTLIRDAIIDKNARIGRNVRIVNPDKLTDAEGPGWAIRDGIVVVMKNAVVPDGTTI